MPVFFKQISGVHVDKNFMGWFFGMFLSKIKKNEGLGKTEEFQVPCPVSWV